MLCEKNHLSNIVFMILCEKYLTPCVQCIAARMEFALPPDQKKGLCYDSSCLTYQMGYCAKKGQYPVKI